MSKFVDESGLSYIALWIKNKLLGKVDKADGKQLTTNDYTDAEKTKLAGIAAGANAYSHPTSSGNKHIPSGCASGKILRWSADGTAVWGDDTDTVYTHPAYAAAAAALIKVGRDASGHVVPGAAVAKADITALGVPGQDTTYNPATSSVSGLMSAADKAKLDAFSAASAYATKSELNSAVTGLYKYKGSKATYSALPTTGNVTGDVWDVQTDGTNYAWTGTGWDALGGALSVPAITNAEIDAILEA